MTVRTTTLATALLSVLVATPAFADDYAIPEATVEAIYNRVMAAGAEHARAEGWSENGPVWHFEHPSLDIYDDDDTRLGSHTYNGGAWVTTAALEAIAALPAESQEQALAFAFARQVADKSDLEDTKKLDPHAVAIYARLGLGAPSQQALETVIEILDETRIASLGPSHGMEFFFVGIRRKARALKVRRRYGSAKAQRKRYQKLLEKAGVGAAAQPAAGIANALPY
jgi:hypothetical protein